jgi:hypothetical protein
MEQATSVRFGADIAMLSVEQSGRFQGSELKLAVRYGAGTASGEGITPGQAGLKPVSYADVAVPDGVIDDNALAGLLPYFKWAPSATFSINVFASGRGVIEQTTLRVSGEEDVAVPLGTFKAYRVDYAGGESPATFWIEMAPPHRVLKLAPVGAPVEFVRVR